MVQLATHDLILVFLKSWRLLGVPRKDWRDEFSRGEQRDIAGERTEAVAIAEPRKRAVVAVLA